MNSRPPYFEFSGVHFVRACIRKRNGDKPFEPRSIRKVDFLFALKRPFLSGSRALFLIISRILFRQVDEEVRGTRRRFILCFSLVTKHYDRRLNSPPSHWSPINPARVMPSVLPEPLPLPLDDERPVSANIDVVNDDVIPTEIICPDDDDDDEKKESSRRKEEIAKTIPRKNVALVGFKRTFLRWRKNKKSENFPIAVKISW